MSRKNKPSTEKPDRNDKGNNNQVLIALITGVVTILVTLITIFGPGIWEEYKQRSLATPTAASTSSVLTNTLASPSSSISAPATILPTPDSPCVATYPPRYGFECNISGWAITDFEGSRAITSIQRTQVKNFQDATTWVLELTVDFTGTKTERLEQSRESGEVEINLIAFRPAGYDETAVDFAAETITAQVMASVDSIGTKGANNGFQLFVKDINGQTCYGKWNNIERENVWFQIYWRQSDAAECKEGFDSSHLQILGLKIAVGEKSQIKYDEGKYLRIYLDDITWK